MIGTLLLTISINGVLFAQVQTSHAPICPPLVGLLATDFVYAVPNSLLPRVEIRQCLSDSAAALQILAWRRNESAPSLVVNTDDFGVVQTVVRANVFVIETGGATRDQVFVIRYDRGSPRLVLRRVTKGTATVSSSESVVNVEITGIYAGDGPPRSEVHRFVVEPEATMPERDPKRGAGR